MKKFTLLLALVSFGLQAQTFPAPYCDIDDSGVSVEEITMVKFANVTILNTDTSSVLVDATNENAFGVYGETLSLEVAGNTLGDFNNDIVAFIDWNKNEILDDAGEIYELGTLTNTDGNDGTTVSMDITIPVDAGFGLIRIRITKIYQDEDSPAEIDPCAISFNPFGQGVFPGYGQALDFGIDVTSAGVNDFDASALNIYPLPTNDVLNIEYKSEITAIEVYNLLGQKVLSQNNDGATIKLDTSSLKAGAYILKLVADGASHAASIIKQ